MPKPKGRKTHQEEIKLLKEAVASQMPFNKEVTACIKRHDKHLKMIDQQINRHDEHIIDVQNNMREHTHDSLSNDDEEGGITIHIQESWVKWVMVFAGVIFLNSFVNLVKSIISLM